MRRNKYGNRKAHIDGITFDSQKEGKRYIELKTLERSSVIQDLELQPEYPLEGRDGPILTPTGRKAKYKADFRYFDVHKQKWVIEDVKGFRTPEYQLKKAILAASGIEVVEV